MVAVYILLVIFAGISLITYVDNTTRARKQAGMLPDSPTPTALPTSDAAPKVASDSTAALILRLPEPQRQQAWTLLCLITDQLHAGLPSADTRTRYLLDQTAQTYLPDTLRAYLQLTPGAAQHLRSQGQEPTTLLSEQLSLIEDGVRTALQHDHAAADRLLTQGRFLRERFGEAEGALRLPEKLRR